MLSGGRSLVRVAYVHMCLGVDPFEVTCMQGASTHARGNNFCEQLCPELAWFITKGVLPLSA